MSEREFEDFLRKLSEQLGREAPRESIAGELRDHLEERLAELSEEGVPHDDAVRLALDEFGEAPALANGFALAGRQRQKRRVARWSGATIVSLTVGIVLLWAMWPQGARVPLTHSSVAQAENDAAAKTVDAADSEGAIERELAKTSEVDFVDTPLTDVLNYLSDVHKITFTMDRPGLEAEGISTDQPVNLKIQNMRLETVLNRLTSDLNVTWTYRDEAIEITTVDNEHTQVITHVYHIHDLLGWGGSETVQGGAEVVSMIEASLGPNQWSNAGGNGTAVVNAGALIVTQSWRLQREIDQFLAEIRKAAALANDPKSTVTSLPLPLETERQIDAALKKNAAVDFVETPLSDVLAFLQEQHRINFAIDKRALEGDGIAADRPVNITSKGASLQSVLNRITRNLQLTWTVAHESIVITTPGAMEKYVTTRLYPVGDLIGVDEKDRDIRAAVVGSLVDMITTNLGHSPFGWTDEGGSGSAQALTAQATIVIAHTDSVHRQVEQLLADLRTSRLKGLTGGKPPNPKATVIKVYIVQPNEAENIDMSQLAKMIQSLVEPESWTNDPQAYVQHVGKRLVVRHTPACQRKVEKFLRAELGLNAFAVVPGSFGGGGGGMGGGGMGGGGMGGGGGGFF